MEETVKHGRIAPAVRHRSLRTLTLEEREDRSDVQRVRGFSLEVHGRQRRFGDGQHKSTILIFST